MSAVPKFTKKNIQKQLFPSCIFLLLLPISISRIERILSSWGLMFYFLLFSVEYQLPVSNIKEESNLFLFFFVFLFV